MWLFWGGNLFPAVPVCLFTQHELIASSLLPVCILSWFLWKDKGLASEIQLKNRSDNGMYRTEGRVWEWVLKIKSTLLGYIFTKRDSGPAKEGGKKRFLGWLNVKLSSSIPFILWFWKSICQVSLLVLGSLLTEAHNWLLLTRIIIFLSHNNVSSFWK